MNRISPRGVGLVLLACAALVALAALRHGRSLRAHQEAIQMLERVREQREEIIALRAAGERMKAPAPGSADLSPSVSQALGASGLEARTLVNLTQRSDRALDAGSGGTRGGGGDGSPGGMGGARVRVVSITLRGVELGALGRFLVYWRANEPLWTVAAIDLSPAPEGDGGLSVVLEMQRVYAPAGDALQRR